MYTAERAPYGGIDALGPVVARVLEQQERTGQYINPLSIKNWRKAGFRALDALVQADPEFRALAPLPTRSQVVIDNAVIQVGLQRLTFVADLLAEGLIYTLPDPLSMTVLEQYKQSRTGAAQRVMNPSARGENGIPDMTPYGYPIYLTTDTFTLDIRTLRQSQRVGLPLDVSTLQQKVRSVNEGIEDAGINGATTRDGQDLKVGGYTAYGLLNEPNVNTQALTVDWTAANVVGTTGPAMEADILAMVTKANLDKFYGPFNLYVGTKAGVVIEGQYIQYTRGTIRNQLESMVFGGRPLRIRVADFMPGASTGTQCALVQMTSDVVDVVQGQQPTVVPYTSLNGFNFHNLIMAIMIPRVKSDYDGNSGVVLGQKA